MEISNFFDFDFIENTETEPPPVVQENQLSSLTNSLTNSQQSTLPNLNNSLIVTTSTTSAQPTMPTQSIQPSSRPRAKFTKLEDEIIIRFVKEKGAHSWNRIIPLLPGRTPRLVRERWVNYLSPDVNLTPFTKEEDDLILQLVSKHGKHWKFISQSFNKRTDIALKNRYMLLQRRERSNLLKQQRMAEQGQQQHQQNMMNPIVLSPSLNTATTIQQPQANYSQNNYLQANYSQNNYNQNHYQPNNYLCTNCPPSMPTLADENSNLDLNTDTESFPTLDDAVVCCSEWDIDSYQCDDLPLLCNFQFEF